MNRPSPNGCGDSPPLFLVHLMMDEGPVKRGIYAADLAAALIDLQTLFYLAIPAVRGITCLGCYEPGHAPDHPMIGPDDVRQAGGAERIHRRWAVVYQSDPIGRRYSFCRQMFGGWSVIDALDRATDADIGLAEIRSIELCRA